MPADKIGSRFRFSLRTLFVVVTVVALPSCWVSYSLNWIRQRHELFAELHQKHWHWQQGSQASPHGLWIFGEPGYEILTLVAEMPTELDRQRIREAFPETEIRHITFPNGTFDIDNITNRLSPPRRDVHQ